MNRCALWGAENALRVNESHPARLSGSQSEVMRRLFVKPAHHNVAEIDELLVEASHLVLR